MSIRQVRRLKVLMKNILSIPHKLKGHIALNAMLQGEEVDPSAAIGSRTRFYRSKLGKYSYIGENCYVESTEIGSFCSIASGCSIGGAVHPMEHVSTSPVFLSSDNVMKKSFVTTDFNSFKNTYIGNDVWVGAGVFVKSGVKIADGAVVGMGSVVTKDIGPYEIWGGNPAHLIRKRFSDDVIEKLLASAWWDCSDEKLTEMAQDFSNVENFLESERWK